MQHRRCRQPHALGFETGEIMIASKSGAARRLVSADDMSTVGTAHIAGFRRARSSIWMGCLITDQLVPVAAPKQHSSTPKATIAGDCGETIVRAPCAKRCETVRNGERQ